MKSVFFLTVGCIYIQLRLRHRHPSKTLYWLVIIDSEELTVSHILSRTIYANSWPTRRC